MQTDRWRSKIAVPKILHALLPRKQIAAQIDNAALDEAVCLIAPYGYGKTSALISWLRDRGLTAAWLTLDDSDNAQTSLLAGFAAAIKRSTGWDGDVRDVLADPEYLPDNQGYLWDVISAAEQKGIGKVLVIDDLWVIREPAAMTSIKDIISSMLGRWRVILLSRSELSPVMNDLFLKRNIYLITINDLAFSPDEVEDFFRINHCAASHLDAQTIYDETEGWPVSLNVVLTLSRNGSAQYGDEAREHISAFFETEIWRGLDQTTRDFLLKTAILERLTPASCNTVTDMGATLPMLRRLYVNGIFISRLDAQDAFRYHRVFRNFLLEKLSASEIDERKLYEKVAWRLFEDDKFEQSFPYFFKAGDLYGLSRVLRIVNSTEMGIDKYIALTGCITGLKVEDLQDYPLIAAKMAQIDFDLGNIAQMQRIYDILVEWVKPGALPLPPEEYAECVWEVGWLSYINPAEPIEKNIKHSEWINYTYYDPNVKTTKGFHSAAYRFPSVLRGLRDHCATLGGLAEFVRLNEEMGYTLISDEQALWQIDIIRAEYAYEREQFAIAEKLIKEVMNKVEGGQVTDLYFVCIALLVKIMRATRGAGGIEALTLRLKKMIEKTRYASLMTGYHAFELRNRLAEGYQGQTEAFAVENRDYLDQPYFFLLYRHITLARALLSTGGFDEALMLLSNLERLCERYDRRMDMMEVNILKSAAEHGLGHGEQARIHLGSALDAAREYGFIRLFSDDAPLIWPVLEVMGQEQGDPYFKNIVISCKKTLARSGRAAGRQEAGNAGLTKTELKILKVLSTDMTYEEIAFDNNVTVSTVKTHIYCIYSKLGVHNRASAVIKARKMGLVR